ncbi:hypothetical protein [Gracilinema caldarium]|uniref:hypothetical protein n=1 Tax=Gracilinema caldarium TaxID=215591 RepID=UPI0026EEAD7C|nr:hypothetical protein [Gracilinema caldarium]
MEGSESEGIFHFEAEGQRALGFDTGLTPQAFAKARLGSLMTIQGIIVDTAVHIWNIDGTVEHQGHMVFYGKDFKGESLEQILNRSDDTPLYALQRYLKALTIISKTDQSLFEQISLFPAGVLIAADGSVFFAPAALAKRVFEYKTPQLFIRKVLQWLHPDKTGPDAAAFTAAAIAYRLFTGTFPFPVSEDTEPEKAKEHLVQDMRDGFCKSAMLAAPRLLPEVTALLDSILCPEKDSPKGLEDLAALLGEPGSKGLADFYKDVESRETELEEQKRNHKRREFRIGTQRFLKKYKYALIAGVGTALALVIIIQSIISDQQKRPTTRGLAPLQVAEAYYRAFNTLDHQMMDACVAQGAGKGDIEAVMNLFVISRVREAYERKTTVLDPETWKSQGSPATDATIFGITDLNLQQRTEIPGQPEQGATCQIEATYAFYYPEPQNEMGHTPSTGPSVTPSAAEARPALSPEFPSTPPSEPPQSEPTPAPSPAPHPALRIDKRKDILTLEWMRDRWRIAAIERTSATPQSDIP